MQTDPRTRKPRWPLVVAMVVSIAVFVMLVVAVAFVVRRGKAFFAKVRPQREPMPTASAAAQARTQRQRPVAEIAPAPIPTALPLKGKPGKDADGYPTQYVDRPALRSLLWHGRYADLTRYLEQFQQDFEMDPKREYWPTDAIGTFNSSEPSLAVALDAWVAATPNSFAPYATRGTYWASVACARRGTKWAADTHGDNFAAMRETARKAVADLDRAISLRPKLVHAMTIRIGMLQLESDRDAMRQEIDKATAVCPTCFRVRVKYILSLTPRWGGSYPQMQAFADEAAKVPNPKLRFLKGYIDYDKAGMFSIDKDHQRALTAIQRACALGDHWQFLHERADAEMRLKDYERALADLDRAAALRPGEPDVLFARAYVNVNLKKWEAAGRDLLDGLRVDPTDATGRHDFDFVLQGLIYDAWEHHKGGRRDDALRVIDLAAELAPTNHDVSGRQYWIVMGTAQDAGGALPSFELAAKQNPDDFRAQQRLTYALMTENQLERAIQVWDGYIAKHPDDGPAYLDRGGMYFRLRKLKEAYADASKACVLGVSEGCARAKQVGPQ